MIVETLDFQTHILPILKEMEMQNKIKLEGAGIDGFPVSHSAYVDGIWISVNPWNNSVMMDGYCGQEDKVRNLANLLNEIFEEKLPRYPELCIALTFSEAKELEKKKRFFFF